MQAAARRAAERLVYGFLAWFESFNSVWQTTLVIFSLWGIESAFPTVDPGHLVFLLVLSLYATFTQNGLAHENKITAEKLDHALETIDRVIDDLYVNSQATLQLAQNETNIQQALVTQSNAITAALAELRYHITRDTKETS